MKDLYSTSNSDYSVMTKTWHKEHSPWKANQIIKMMRRNSLNPISIVEVGCGVGEILKTLNTYINDLRVTFTGYDIAIDAINSANAITAKNEFFICKDFTRQDNVNYDLLLMIDVFEHVPDYISFIESCNSKSTYKIFHIPLDIHISSILRNKMIDARKSVGHLHYFTKNTALATLEDTGLNIIDFFYTNSSFVTPNLKTRLANIPRRIMFQFFPDLTVKLFGGYSLLVLAK